MSARKSSLFVCVALIAVAAVDAGVATASTARAGSTKAVAAKAQKKSKDKGSSSNKAAGPTVSVLGFGMNRLWVAHGHIVKSESECSEMVDGEGSPVGPPQEVIISVFVHAHNVSSDAPVRFKDELPDDGEEAEQAEFSSPIAFDHLLEKYDKGVFFSEPPKAEPKETFHFPLESALVQFGENEGPSAEEFDGTYSFTVSVDAGGSTLTSTGKVVVECPYLR